MKSKHAKGFTLIEMAIALLIMGLLLGGGLTVLSAQIEQQRFKDTERLLGEAREAVIGFALANGRLPCPASGASAGRESFCTNGAGACGVAIVPPPAAVPAHGRCTNPNDGFLPASTLGFSPVDPAGYAMDAWALPQNRIHYAVTASNGSAFTAPNGMSNTTMATLAPDLSVCASGTGINPVTCGAAVSLTATAVAVIYSLGENAATGGTGTDETANPNPNSADANQTFVSHTRAAAAATNGEFDDIVIWIAPGILYNRMVQAGRLP